MYLPLIDHTAAGKATANALAKCRQVAHDAQ